MPTGAIPFQQAVAAREVLPVDAGDGVFFPAPPGTDLNSRGAAEAEALLQKLREHGMRGRHARRTAAAQCPPGTAEEMRNASPQQPDQRARLGHLPFRGQQEMGSEPLLAAIGRSGQPLQPGYGKRERAELHDAARDVDVGDHAAHAAEQKTIAWGIRGIVERGLEFRRIAVAENLREEIPQGHVIGHRAANHGASHAALAGQRLIAAGQRLIAAAQRLIAAAQRLIAAAQRFIAALHFRDDRLNPCADTRDSFPRGSHYAHFQLTLSKHLSALGKWSAEENPFYPLLASRAFKKSFK